MRTFIFLLAISILSAYITNPTSKPWPRHTIDDSSSGADGIKFGDFNGDGLLDIVTGWEEGGITKLYIQPKENRLKSPWPSVKVGDAPSVEDAVFVDMNGDGILDVLSCLEGKTRDINIHLAPKKDSLEADRWITQKLPASENMMQWMYAEPLQVDGINGMDFIAAGKGEDGAIGWFEAPMEAENLHDWQWNKMSDMGWVMSLILRDMDNDGDSDVIVTDRRGGLRGCRWLENPGRIEQQKKLWKNHFIGARDVEVMFMTMADMNGDDIEEVVMVERTLQTIRIFERSDSLAQSWGEKTVHLPTSIGKAKSVEVGDLNGDGIKDMIVSTNTEGPGKHGLIWINGKEIHDKTAALEFESISGIHNAKYDRVELMDVDRDGDLDVLICEENYGEKSEGLGIIWYENVLNED